MTTMNSSLSLVTLDFISSGRELFRLDPNRAHRSIPPCRVLDAAPSNSAVSVFQARQSPPSGGEAIRTEILPARRSDRASQLLDITLSGDEDNAECAAWELGNELRGSSFTNTLSSTVAAR